MTAEAAGRCGDADGAKDTLDIEAYKAGLNQLLVHLVANYNLLAKVYLVLTGLPTSRLGVIREGKNRRVH